MYLILGMSAFVFSCCCLAGSLITLWPEIATRGRRKNISWWVWIAGSITGLVFFYFTTVMNPSVDTALLLPLPGIYREEASATYKDPWPAAEASTTVAEQAATGVSPVSGNPGANSPAAGNPETGSPDTGSPVLVKAGDSVRFIGGINGNLYHIPGCYLVDRIPPENQRYFKSRAQAESAGYKPCPDCRP